MLLFIRALSDLSFSVIKYNLSDSHCFTFTQVLLKVGRPLPTHSDGLVVVMVVVPVSGSDGDVFKDLLADGHGSGFWCWQILIGVSDSPRW